MGFSKADVAKMVRESRASGDFDRDHRANDAALERQAREALQSGAVADTGHDGSR
jgi:hypothetical protein